MALKSTPTEKVVSYQKPSTGYWVIPTENGDLHLAQELIPAMTQDNLATFVSPEGFRALSMKDYVGKAFAGLYDLRNKGSDAESAMQFVRSTLRNKFPNTLTRIRYTPSGKDKVIHNYGTPDHKTIGVNFVGDDGDITEVLSLKACLALTGRKPEEVAEIMRYINGTDSFMWRLNSKPSSVDERVAWFGAGSDRAVLYCDRDPTYSDSSLGVRFVARKKI